jgi:hypothetical protein
MKQYDASAIVRQLGEFPAIPLAIGGDELAQKR